MLPLTVMGVNQTACLFRVFLCARLVLAFAVKFWVALVDPVDLTDVFDFLLDVVLAFPMLPVFAWAMANVVLAVQEYPLCALA